MSLLIYASQFSTIRTLSTSHSKCNKCFMTLLSNLVYVCSVCYRAVGTGRCVGGGGAVDFGRNNWSKTYSIKVEVFWEGHKKFWHYLVTSNQRERFHQIVRHSELIEFKIFVINCPHRFSDIPTSLLLLLLEDGRKNPKESRKFWKKETAFSFVGRLNCTFWVQFSLLKKF